MKAWFAMGIAVALTVISFAAFAGDHPRRQHLSWWDAMILWQGPPKQEQAAQEAREAPKPKEPPRWGWKKPKPPCECVNQITGGEAVNYPPYDVEP